MAMMVTGWIWSSRGEEDAQLKQPHLKWNETTERMSGGLDKECAKGAPQCVHWFCSADFMHEFTHRLCFASSSVVSAIWRFFLYIQIGCVDKKAKRNGSEWDVHNPLSTEMYRIYTYI